VCVQVPVQWSYSGLGSDPSVPVGCFLYQTLLQGSAQTVSAHLTTHLLPQFHVRV